MQLICVLPAMPSFSEEGELKALTPGPSRGGRGEFAHRLDAGARVNALVDVQRDGGRLEGGMLGLARPDQLRVEVRVVGVALLVLVRVGVGLRRHQTGGRVVDPRLIAVLVGLDRSLGLGLLLSCHQILTVGFVMR